MSDVSKALEQWFWDRIGSQIELVSYGHSVGVYTVAGVNRSDVAFTSGGSVVMIRFSGLLYQSVGQEDGTTVEVDTHVVFENGALMVFESEDSSPAIIEFVVLNSGVVDHELVQAHGSDAA